MDSDGTIDKRDGWCYFTQVREQLVGDFIEVCNSLGMKCKKVKRSGKLNNYPDGSSSVGQDYFVVSICTDETIFRLKRKAEHQSKKSHTSKDKYITVKNIEKIDSQDVQCITVDSPDNTFLFSKSFKVTHNCFDLTSANYSTVEATQLAFLTDTLAPLLEKIEQEFERKLFAPDEEAVINFEESALLRTDKSSQADYYAKLIQIGVMTPAEVRKQLGLSYRDGSDILITQVNQTTLDKISDPESSDN